MGALREVEGVRNNAGAWLRRDHTVLRLTGRDAGSWLQAQTSNDVRRLESGRGMNNALLDRQGRVLAFFSMHRWEDEYWVIIEKSQVQSLMERVASHVILEEVCIEDVGSDTPQILVEGPRSLVFLASAIDASPEEAASGFPSEDFAFAPLRIHEHEVLTFRMGESGEDGFLLITAPGESQELFDSLLDSGNEFGLVEVSEGARNALRIEAATLRYGLDVDARCVVSETPIESGCVSYEKGCYLGQEVVARLKAYGSPKQALMGLIIDEEGVVLPPAGGSLLREGHCVGTVRSSVFSPTLRRWIAMAYLDRDHRTPGTLVTLRVETMTRPFAARVTALPFHAGTRREDFARQRYDEALRSFEADAEDVDPCSIGLLREAVLLEPGFEDAYEALGVILHRHQRTDEAIHWMKRLARKNPNSVMAHTNLSVFYVSKGMITEAEDEKAIARQLETRSQLDARAAKKMAEEERARIRGEAEERIGMFLEVLDIDPEDPVATMGLGSAYLQLDRPADAVPYLEMATRLKKDFSAAYLKLGRCHEFLGATEAARAAYRAGIEAASRKGNLMPLREMERRLAAIERMPQRGIER